MKQIKLSLTTKDSIKKAIKRLEEIEKNLSSRNENFCQRLAEIGVHAAETTLATKGHGDSPREAAFNVEFVAGGEKVTAILTITSTPRVLKDGRKYYPHLGWEFGAGIYYNNGHANPKAGELGMGVGTFPDQKHAFDDAWYYRDDAGNLHLSKGTEAIMPMHSAVVEMMNSIETVAKEVYSGI